MTDSNDPLVKYTDGDEAEKKTLTPEQERFEKRSPLVTLLIFAIGPLMFNTGISFHDAFDLFLISLRYKEDHALQVVGFASLVRFLCLCVAIYFSQALITKIGGLMGAKKMDAAVQVVTDLFRLGFLTMCVVPVMFYFAAKPMLIFMNCDEATAEEGRAYLTPLLIAMPFITIFQMSCGFLQSEGRSILCGAMQLTGFALNCGVLSPIMLFGVRVNLSLAGLSFALSQSLVGIVLMFFIFGGKFGLKPTWRSWCKPFMKDSFHGMLLALPFLVNVLAATLPPMLLLTMMMKAAGEAGNQPEVGAVFPVFIKLNSAINSVSIGFCQGFLGAGSYANGAQNFRRLLHLFLILCALTWFYHAVLMPILVFKTEWPCSIWLTKKEDLDLAKKMVRIPFYTNTLIPLNFALVNFLLCMKKPLVALALTIVRGGLYVAYTFILYRTGKDNPIRMMYAYNMDDSTLFLLGILAVLKPFIEVCKKVREPKGEYVTLMSRTA